MFLRGRAEILSGCGVGSVDAFFRGESLTLLTCIDQPDTRGHLCGYVTDFQLPNRGAHRACDIKGNVVKKAKRKQAYFLVVEWTFVYGNGFGRLPATGTSQSTQSRDPLQSITFDIAQFYLPPTKKEAIAPHSWPGLPLKRIA